MVDLRLRVTVVITALLVLPLVAALLDGGDFVILDADNIVSQHSQHGHQNDVCSNPRYWDNLLSSLVPREDPSSAPSVPRKAEEVLQEMKPDITEAKDLPRTEGEVKKTPPVIKAIPVSTSPEPVADIKAEKVEVETQTEEKPQAQDENNRRPEDYPRQESAVEEDSIDDPNVPPAKEQDVIAPFSQWAEKKLEEQKKDEPEVKQEGSASTKPVSNNHVKTNGVHKMNKNFASPDCSAKIVGANPGSQGSGNVISTSRDEYFLNKCTDKAWFVVELCESIKAIKVQIANFELYSSSPAKFKVSIGHVFPARDKDWIEFGTFDYEDVRSVQTFANEVGVVGKYAKVEILTHHGNEHFCPVSLFKVFGIPEIDLITEEDDNPAEDDTVPAEDIIDDEPTHHPIVQTIKDAVHKVVNVFRPQNVSLVETLNTSSLEGASLRFRLRPEHGEKYDADVINRYHMIYYLLATQYIKVKQYNQMLNISRVLPCLCQEYGVTFVKQKTLQRATGPWQFVKFLRAFHGDDFLVALCNIESMESGESKLVEKDHGNNMSVTGNGVTNSTTDKDQGSKVTLTNYEDSKPVIVEQIELTKNSSETEESQAPGINEAIIDISLEQGATKEEPVKPPVVEIPKTPSAVTNQVSVQTTWQKLSNRIKALERNVTLSTGFLEELSLKYIKQIEELNTAVKLANDAIAGILKREEVSKERNNNLVTEVTRLTEIVDRLEGRLTTLQDEILARHGLLLLGEVLFIGLVFLLCRPDNVRNVSRLTSASIQDNRRRSLDTMKDERYKSKSVDGLEKRRSSIEVGCLGNGSLVQRLDSVGLTKKQKKRKRRKDSKQMLAGLRNVTEELESDNSGTQEQVTGERRRVRRRSTSWSDQIQDNVFQMSPTITLSHDTFPMQSTPFKPTFSNLKYSNGSPDSNHDDGWKCKESKNVRFPSTKHPHHLGCQAPAPTSVTNMYTLLDHRYVNIKYHLIVVLTPIQPFSNLAFSVHDLDSSACDTESEERRGNYRLNPNKAKLIRSKSSSPNRQVTATSNDRIINDMNPLTTVFLG